MKGRSRKGWTSQLSQVKAAVTRGDAMARKLERSADLHKRESLVPPAVIDLGCCRSMAVCR